MKFLKSSIVINITKGFIWQGVGIVATLVSLPISIKFLGKYEYGLWITVYGTILWMSSFDFGIGNGFRNELAIAFTHKDKKESAKIVSNAFFAMSILSIILTLIGLIINAILYNNLIFNIHYFKGVYGLVNLLLIFFGFEMILKFTGTIYTADQRSSVTPFITGVNNVIILLIVYLFFLNKEFLVTNRLLVYGVSIAAVPLITNGLLTLICFSKEYRYLKPRIANYDFSWIQRILKTGIEFFGIQIAMIFLLQLSNILITTWSNAEYVTIINVADKYFGVISIIGTIILFPFWSAFTAANEKGDHVWVKNTIKKLELTFGALMVLGGILLIAFPYVVKIWFKQSQDIFIPQVFSIIILLKYLFILLNSIYSYYLNGIGKVKLQLVMYVILAILNVPVSWFLFKFIGTVGIIIFLPLAMLSMAISQKYYIMRVLNQKLKLEC